MVKNIKNEKEYIKFLDAQISEAKKLKEGDTILVYSQKIRKSDVNFFDCFEGRETYTVDVVKNLTDTKDFPNQVMLQVTSQMILDCVNIWRKKEHKKKP